MVHYIKISTVLTFFITSYQQKFNARNFIYGFPVLVLSKNRWEAQSGNSLDMLAQRQCCWSEAVIWIRLRQGQVWVRVRATVMVR